MFGADNKPRKWYQNLGIEGKRNGIVRQKNVHWPILLSLLLFEEYPRDMH